MPALAVSCNFSSMDPAQMVVGTPYSHFFLATGGTPPYSYNISAWPFGVNPINMGFDPSTGELFGVPNTDNWNPGDVGSHVFTFLLRATDSVGAVVYLGCSIESFLTRPAIAIFGSTPNGSTGVPYTGAITATGGQAPYTFSLTGNGALPNGLSMDGDGNITGTPTLNGIYTFEVQVDGTGGGLNNSATQFFQITIGAGIVSVSFGWQLYYYAYGFTGPLAIGCGTPPDAVRGVPYAHSIAVIGGTPPYTFSIVGGALPTGLSINALTGVISGTPTVAGIFGFSVQVVDAEATTVSVGCSITVHEPLAITCDNPPDGAVGAPYSHFFPATGGVEPYAFDISAGIAPVGLTLDPLTGELSGTPTVAGLYTFTVRVTDSYTGNGPDPDTATVECSILITGDISVDCNNPPKGNIGKPYTHTFTTTGGTPPYVYTLAGGTLPPGLTLDAATGELTGTPTLSGFYEFTIRATDADEAAGQTNCSILIKRCLLVDLT